MLGKKSWVVKLTSTRSLFLKHAIVGSSSVSVGRQLALAVGSYSPNTGLIAHEYAGLRFIVQSQKAIAEALINLTQKLYLI